MKFLVLTVLAFIIINNAKSQDEIQAVVSGISDSLKWAKSLKDAEDRKSSGVGPKLALDVCVKMYEGSKARLERLVKPNSFNWDDAVAWLSGALSGNTACLDGLTETGMSPDTSVAQKLKLLLTKALTAAEEHDDSGVPNIAEGDNLINWKPGSSKGDAVDAQDGS